MWSRKPQRICNVETRRVEMYFWIFFKLKFQVSNASPCIVHHTHLDKLIKADLPILIQIARSHQVFCNFSHSVPRQRQASRLEQVIQLIAADVPIAIRICKANDELRFQSNSANSMKRGDRRLAGRWAGSRGNYLGITAWPHARVRISLGACCYWTRTLASLPISNSHNFKTEV